MYYTGNHVLRHGVLTLVLTHNKSITGLHFFNVHVPTIFGIMPAITIRFYGAKQFLNTIVLNICVIRV